MQASRTAHYAWLYRGSRASRVSPNSQSSAQSHAHAWPNEVAPKQLAGASDPRLGVAALRPRVSPFARGARSGELALEASISAAIASRARAHFIEAQIRDAVQSGIRQMVWLGPRATQAAQIPQSARSLSSLSVELGVEVEVFRLESGSGFQLQGALRANTARGVRAVLDRSLVRSARTLFVCDGLLERTPAAQIQAILRMIGDSCFGSRLACLYVDRGLISGQLSSAGSHTPRVAVPRLGEPTQLGVQLGVDTRSLPALLGCAGLVLDADIGLSDYVRRYLGAAPSDLRGYGCCRLVAAHVRAVLQESAQESVQENANDSGPLN